jgi:hypothetical protein
MKGPNQNGADASSLEVRVNWEGLRKFLKFQGTIEEMRRLEVPRSSKTGT